MAFAAMPARSAASMAPPARSEPARESCLYASDRFRLRSGLGAHDWVGDEAFVPRGAGGRIKAIVPGPRSE
jgi:hypothetical protein